MRSVFVSYRRGDSEGQARALKLELVKVIGNESVFMDVDSIALGQDFRRILHERLVSCDLMLVLIGPHWLDAKDTAGNRRLDNATDLIRQEIAAALKRNIPVTPVLLQGTHMPSPEGLPDDIKELVYRNGFELGHSTWESDVSEMIKRLGLSTERTATTHRGVRTQLTSAMALISGAFKINWVLPALIAAVLIVVFYRNARESSSGNEIDALIQQPAASASQGSEIPPAEPLAGFGNISVINLKTATLEVYEQNSRADNYLSAGYAGTISPKATTLQVPVGTYKLKMERVFVEHIRVASGHSIKIALGTISLPGVTRGVEVYEQNSEAHNYLSPGYAGTIKPPETTLQVPAGTYKLKIEQLFMPPVRVEAGQVVRAQ